MNELNGFFERINQYYAQYFRDYFHKMKIIHDDFLFFLS